MKESIGDSYYILFGAVVANNDDKSADEDHFYADRLI